MTDTSTVAGAVDRFLVREVLDKYLGALDDKDWQRIASCFTDDAIAHYNNESEDIVGGKGVADWLHRMVAYSATDHSLSNAEVVVTGDKAFAHSRVIATLQQGDEGVGRIQVRGIDYKDQLVRVNGEWRIKERLHAATMQFDAPSVTRVLYKGNASSMRSEDL